MRRLDDKELMQQVKDGEIAAFEQIVDRHKGMVYGLCYSMLRSREDAEEAAQDTFLKLFRSRDLFDAERALGPWLLRIAGNTSRDVLRRRRGNALPVLHDQEGQSILHLLEDPRDEDRAEKEVTSQAVQHAIEQMSERFRLPLVLRYQNGMTNQQIADALEISVSNVKLRLARAKDVLQGRLAEVRDQ